MKFIGDTWVKLCTKYFILLIYGRQGYTWLHNWSLSRWNCYTMIILTQIYLLIRGAGHLVYFLVFEFDLKLLWLTGFLHKRDLVCAHLDICLWIKEISKHCACAWEVCIVDLIQEKQMFVCSFDKCKWTYYHTSMFLTLGGRSNWKNRVKSFLQWE